MTHAKISLGFVFWQLSFNQNWHSFHPFLFRISNFFDLFDFFNFVRIYFEKLRTEIYVRVLRENSMCMYLM